MSSEVSDETGVAGVVVDGYETEDGVQWVVWCDWCVMWHRYGAGEGDRAAHCDPDTGSPYQRIGYVLRYAGQWTDEVRAQHADDERRGKRARSQWNKLRGDRRAVEWRDVYEGRIGTVKSPSGLRRLTPAEDLARGLMLAAQMSETSQTHLEDDGEVPARTRVRRDATSAVDPLEGD